MACCGRARSAKTGGTPAKPTKTTVSAPAFRLRDSYAMPIPGGWPVRVTESAVVKAASLREAQSKLRLAGKASTLEAAQENICRELIAMGRPEACVPTGPMEDNRFFGEDVRYDSDPRGPQDLTRGTYGADALAWARLHRRALDGRMHADYLRYFGSAIGCHLCQRHWYEFLKANPPDFSTSDAQFEFSVRAHNHANAQRGVPEMSLEDALALWSAPATQPGGLLPAAQDGGGEPDGAAPALPGDADLG